MRPTHTRREALKLGGGVVTLGALIAACGEGVGGNEEAGRVGNAPLVEALPDYAVDDAVLLRTASSLEYTAAEAIRMALDLEGAVPDELVATMERLITDHEETGREMEELTSAAGGEPWGCSNPWFMERLVQPVFDAIQSPVVGIVLGSDLSGRVRVLGEELDPTADGVTTSNGSLVYVDQVELDGNGQITTIDGSPALEDDEVRFARSLGEAPADVISFVNALETFAAASHQELAVMTTDSAARTAHTAAAALEARHAAELAIDSAGPDRYVSPALLGEEVPTDASGQILQFAIPSVFGLTSQIEIKAGPGDQNNVRTSYVLQTPAANSFIYNELTGCDA